MMAHGGKDADACSEILSVVTAISYSRAASAIPLPLSVPATYHHYASSQRSK